jgi:cation:H+ antiporter
VPELATSIVAAIRGERDIAVGNIVGSSIFNIFAILGVAGFVSAQGIRIPAAAEAFDIPVMIAVAVACLPIFFTGSEISRAEGALFLAYYAAYVTYLVLGAAEHAALPAFSNMMTLFVIPLTLLGLIFSLARTRNRNRRSGKSTPRG